MGTNKTGFPGLESTNDTTKYLRGDGTWQVPAGSATVLNMTCDGRLTLTTALPVTIADVSGASSIYFTPYRGNRIALYDGSNWNIRTFTEITINLAALTSGKPYDLFAYDNAGTVAFDSPLVWTNDTTRATALTTQDGVYVKSGDTTRRYIGTFYTTSTTTTEDSVTKRYLFNYYNRVERKLKITDTTDTWTYSTATWRRANGSASNVVNLVNGNPSDEQLVSLHSTGTAHNSAGGIFVAVGVGLDSTTVNSADLYGGPCYGSHAHIVSSSYSGYCGVGKHTYSWLEIAQASGTTTWYGDGGLTYLQAGMSGWCWA